MMKKLLITSAVVGGIGILMSIGFQVVAGVQYRMSEDQGLEPGYSPDWIVFGTYAGLLLFLSGLLLAFIALVLYVLRRARVGQPQRNRS